MAGNEINNKISDLWKKYPEEIRGKYHPLYYPDFNKGGLLFIGINPSFSPKGFRQALKDTEYEGTNPKEFYNFTNLDFQIGKAIAIENHVRKQHDYFKKFDKISKETGKNWEHIDLFLYRETSQLESNKIINYSTKGGKVSMNEFGREQLTLVREEIKLISPKVIVVVNARASEILRTEFLIEKLDSSSELGFQTLEVNGNKIPIFFSGMLTGQRALDKGSFERLVWHIKRALNQK
ncbi:MAG TPA: hypothetical protein VJK07_00205 [Candidatus Nanoarchaeia archaeon]|nr:hypothetical protein [Candidatus Nanoarchaeia archaeon]